MAAQSLRPGEAEDSCGSAGLCGGEAGPRARDAEDPETWQAEEVSNGGDARKKGTLGHPAS
jgi:hypothetical protein